MDEEFAPPRDDAIYILRESKHFVISELLNFLTFGYCLTVLVNTFFICVINVRVLLFSFSLSMLTVR